MLKGLGNLGDMAKMMKQAQDMQAKMTDMQEDMVKAVKSTIHEAVTDAGLSTDSVKIIEGDPAHEICQAAEAQGAELIIMGAGQRNIVDRILLGSTAHGVLNNTPCDVYIAR